MASQIFTVGTRVRYQAEFRNLDGALETPSAYSGKHKDPSGNTTTVAQGSVTVESTGILYFDVTLDEEGTWWFQLAGTAGLVAAVEMYCKAESGF